MGMKSLIVDKVFTIIMAIIMVGLCSITLYLHSQKQAIYNAGYKAGVVYGRFIEMTEVDDGS
jgi:hypothetical protein